MRKADATIGVTTEVLDIHDGEIVPTLENCQRTICLIREWRADSVIVHRPWDFHPDRRYVGMLTQDADFMATEPCTYSDVPPLKKSPVFRPNGAQRSDRPA